MGWKRRSSAAIIADIDVVAAARRAAVRWQRFVERRAAELTPVAKAPEGLSDTGFAGSRGRAPGTAKESWHSGEVVVGGVVVSASVGSDDPIMPYIVYNTRPHIIRPSADRAGASVTATGKPRGSVSKGNAALRFYVGGKVVYAREVHHPGTTGHFQIQRACAESIPVLERYLREEFERELTGRPTREPVHAG